MKDLYSAAPLEPANADHAFPLVSLRHPGLTLRDFRGGVRRLSRAPRDREGLVMVRNARGCVLAVFAYRTGTPLVGGLVLRVTDVIMGRLPGDALPDAVAACAEDLARDLGHARIAIEFADDTISEGEAGVLARAGFANGGRLVVRTAPAALASQPRAAVAGVPARSAPEHAVQT